MQRDQYGLYLLFVVCTLYGCNAPPVVNKVGGVVPQLRFDGYLPSNAILPGWKRIGKIQRFSGNGVEEYIGQQSQFFRNYGLNGLFVADYAPEGADYPILTVESYQMEKPLAGSGIFHYYQGQKYRGVGVPVDVGVSGFYVRNVLYFYKDRFFYKIIYTGKDKVPPDLVVIGRAIAAEIPGEARPPRGFEFLSVEGVNPKDALVSGGYTFNYDFLPPSISAAAPGAGKIARVFLISHYDEDESAKTGRDYRYFLERNGLNYEFKRTSDGRLVWWARDTNQGRVIVTQYKKWVVGVLTPETYETGEQILDRVVQQMRNE